MRVIQLGPLTSRVRRPAAALCARPAGWKSTRRYGGPARAAAQPEKSSSARGAGSRTSPAQSRCASWGSPARLPGAPWGIELTARHQQLQPEHPAVAGLADALEHVHRGPVLALLILLHDSPVLERSCDCSCFRMLADRGGRDGLGAGAQRAALGSHAPIGRPANVERGRHSPAAPCSRNVCPSAAANSPMS